MIKHRKGSLNKKADALSRKAEYRKGLLRNKVTILTKEKDGLIRLYERTLVIVIRVRLTEVVNEIKKA